MQIIEKVVLSSIAIIVVLIIRALFQRRINPTVIYALWLLAAVRLLWPGVVGTSPFSVMNTGLWRAGSEVISREYSRQSKVGKQHRYQEYLERITEKQREGNSASVAGKEISNAENIGEKETLEEQAQESKNVEIVLLSWQMATLFGKLQFAVVSLWIAGMVFFAVVFLVQNITLYRYLRRTGKKWKEVNVGKRRISVFVAGNNLPSPCLFGIFPAIYIPERCAGNRENEENEERLAFILEHELTHYRHGDFLWAFVRVLCLIIAWYNPLVWFAARLSVRDSELACDAGCMKRLGKEKRIAYGETLIAMVLPAKESKTLLWHATMMTSGGRFMKKRMESVVGDRKSSMAAAVIVIALTALGASAVFTGSDAAGNREAEVRTADSAY